MTRRTFLYGLTAAATLIWAGGAVFAASYAEDVVSQLTRQGFYNIAVDTTWLGRVRIHADRADGAREIILNPRTGEILRDSWQAAGNGRVTPIIDDIDESSANTGSDSGSGGGDDNSGSGSDGSGNDGSGSGSGGDEGGGDDHSGGGDSGHGGDDKGDDKSDGKDN